MSEHATKDLDVAVLIPCYNEAPTIGKVVSDFRRHLPEATIFVYDNNSSDGTAEIAEESGAVVRREKRQGKGFVVRSMFEDADADIAVMVDGDDTYPADQVRALIRPVAEGEADMTVGARLADFTDESFRPFHTSGNRLVARTVNFIFGARLTDVLSGYRAFSRDFMKKTAIVAKGFEVETQMTVQALYNDFVIAEVPIRYGERPAGSFSKLRTFRDGIRILVTIVDIFKAYRPLLFFSAIAACLLAIGLAVGSIPIIEFLRTGRILHFPSAIAASGIVIISAIVFACGLILDSVNYRVRELRHMITTRLE